MKKNKQLILISFSILITPNLLAHSLFTSGCSLHPEMQAARTKELQYLVDADQKERLNFSDKSEEEHAQLYNNDLIRRKRVGEIFGEGCFKYSSDYAAAALIFQHGDVSDHFFHAFTWAHRAVELGDEKQKWLMAAAMDRYLVSLGKKQLFGTQAYADQDNPCFCIEPIEETFPDSQRQKYTRLTLNEQYKVFEQMNEKNNCPTIECNHTLEETPQGSIIGFW